MGEQFYEAITKFPVPLDMRTLKALKKSPLALDLYAWLAYRSFRASQTKEKKPVFVSWKLLQQQFGASYNDTDNLKKHLKTALRKVRAIYRDMSVEDVSGGLRLSASLSLITPR